MNLDHAGGIALFAAAISLLVVAIPRRGRWAWRLFGASTSSEVEQGYLQSLIRDLEQRNSANNWADSLYVPVASELRQPHSWVRLHQKIEQRFYLVRALHGSTRQVFNTLSNIEKIDSSRGTTFSTLRDALDRAEGNAVIILAPPGGGKSVSLRNLALADARAVLAERSARIPIFLDLGNYKSYAADGDVLPFSEFLEEFFAKSGYLSHLAGGRWRDLLLADKCTFYLDGLDELPRRPPEYEKRTRAIQAFVRQWPRARFLLTCREQDYDHQLTFQQVLIKPFDDSQISRYLRRYFQQRRKRDVLEPLLGNESLLELCRNPFYLNLVCLYCRSTDRLPESRVQLFQFLVESVVERENAKHQNPAERFTPRDLGEALSQLAFFMAVGEQSTTVDLDHYRAHLARTGAPDRHDRMIRLGIASNLLVANPRSNELRFCHNRIQEYFSAFVFTERYREPGFELPANFFTNIWWAETILFIAGLDKDASDFIRLLLARREAFSDPVREVNDLLRLDLLVLAFRCIFANLQFCDTALLDEVRSLLFAEFARGSPLERAKIAATLRLDRSDATWDFLRHALDDESCWVSEAAFFAISQGELQLGMTYWRIIAELFRFFSEGRIFSTVGPVLRCSRASPKLKRLLPFFGLLLAATVVCGASILAVMAAFGHFLLFKLEYALTALCLRCLLALAMATFAIAWFLAHEDGRLLRRAIRVTPLTILAYLFVLAGPNPADPLIVRAVGIGAGVLLAMGYRRIVAPKARLSLGVVTTYSLGHLVCLAALRLVIAPQQPIDPGVFGGTIGRALLASELEATTQELRRAFEPEESAWPAGEAFGDEGEVDNAIRWVVKQIVARRLEPQTEALLARVDARPWLLKGELSSRAMRDSSAEFAAGRLRGPADLRRVVELSIATGLEPVALRVAADRAGKRVFYGVLLLMAAVLAALLVWQASTLLQLGRSRRRVLEVLRDARISNDGEPHSIEALVEVIGAQRASWARRLLVDFAIAQLVAQAGSRKVLVLTFLTRLAKQMVDSDLRDAVLQELEHEQRNYRRSLRGRGSEAGDELGPEALAAASAAPEE